MIASEGGTITFLFTEVRPPPRLLDDDMDGRPSEKAVTGSARDTDAGELGQWQEEQVAALEDARDLLRERGLGDERLSYAWADQADEEGAAQAIADEAAAGSYDLVVLSSGYFTEEVED